MLKILSFLFPLFLFCQEIEVRLSTQSPLVPLYISRFQTDATNPDWRKTEELREVLEFDLNVGGFCKVVPTSESFEERLTGDNGKFRFDLATWKKTEIPYVLTAQVNQNHLILTAFDALAGTSKKYPAARLTGKIEMDRQMIHHLADAVHKDLFDKEGIASLKILYTHRSLEDFSLARKAEVWKVDFDGENRTQLTYENGYCLSPSFFPHNGEFFYVNFKEGQSKIYRLSLAEAKKTGKPLVSLRGNQALPAISSDGKHIAFISDVAGRPDLFIQNLDGKGNPIGKARQLFTEPRASQASPTFSPDGKQIAFISDKDGPPRIYVLDVAGPKDTQKPKPKLLTKRNRENTSPAWSPDGKKLAYSAKVDGIRQIWLYDFATGEEIPLTTGPEMKENPAWAPDSLHLIYNTESEESCELFLLNIRDVDPIQISKGEGLKRFPCWETRFPIN